VCPEYGKREPAPVCEYHLTTHGSTELLTFVLPVGAHEVRVSQTAPGTFALTGDDLSDLHVFGHAAGSELGEHGWIWHRRDPMTAASVARVVVDGALVSSGSGPAVPDSISDRNGRVERLAGTSKAN
jgi:hypothetical protein